MLLQEVFHVQDQWSPRCNIPLDQESLIESNARDTLVVLNSLHSNSFCNTNVSEVSTD